MSTRALYTFKGETAADTWNVYKHCDGYPRGAANVLKTVLDYFAWALPRYEADEFAAAFCAAGKCGWLWNQKFNQADFKDHSPGGRLHNYNGGNVRLMPQGKPLSVALKCCADIEYRYEISQANDQELRIRAYSVNAWEAPGSEILLVDCKLSEFAAWAKEQDKEAA
jgi:hypothetical protein